MPQLPLALDALTKAVTPFLEDELVVADPANTLAALIDLAGGVALAEGLAEVDAPAATAKGDPRALFQDVATHVDTQLQSAFSNAWRPRYRLPTPARALQTYTDAGIADADGRAAKRKALTAMARVLWAPFNEFLETQWKRARFAIRDLRVEVVPMLAALGPDAGRLVQLDAALAAGTRQQVEALLRRVPYAWGRTFRRQLKSALAELPETPCLADFDPWFATAGWVTVSLADGQQLVTALVARDRRRLADLIEAAHAAARPGPAVR